MGSPTSSPSYHFLNGNTYHLSNSQLLYLVAPCLSSNDLLCSLHFQIVKLQISHHESEPFLFLCSMPYKKIYVQLTQNISLRDEKLHLISAHTFLCCTEMLLRLTSSAIFTSYVTWAHNKPSSNPP